MIIDSQKLYLDYMNNYLTVEAVASNYEISEGIANMHIDRGRFINEEEAKAAKRAERKKLDALLVKKNVSKAGDVVRSKSFGLMVIFNNGLKNDPSWFCVALKYYENVETRYSKAVMRERDTKSEILEELGE